ncbi:hypothetical protein GGF50DRAFT_110170 [Schizophyllum commune]
MPASQWWHDRGLRSYPGRSRSRVLARGRVQYPTTRTNRSIRALAALACAVTYGDPPVSSRLAPAGVGALQKRDAQLPLRHHRRLYRVTDTQRLVLAIHPRLTRARRAYHPSDQELCGALQSATTPFDRPNWRAALRGATFSPTRVLAMVAQLPLESLKLTEPQEVDPGFFF